MNSTVSQSPYVTQRGVNIKGTAKDCTIVVTQVGPKDAMDSIKAQIAAIRHSCAETATALEVASVTGGPTDKVADASTLRRMSMCAVILNQEVRQLTKAGISHFKLILEQSHTAAEKIAQVLRPSVDQNIVFFLKESPEKIREVRTDTALLDVLLLHLEVMVAVVRLTAGGKHVTYYNNLLEDLIEDANSTSRRLVQKPSYLTFSQPDPPLSPPQAPTFPQDLLSPSPPIYTIAPETKVPVDAKRQDVKSPKKIHKWAFLSFFHGTPKGESVVVPTIPRPPFPENIVCTHVATLGAEPQSVLHRPAPRNPRPSSHASLPRLEDITEEAATKAMTTFFKYTMTPKDGWHTVDVTRENVKEEELRSRVSSMKDVQRTKSGLKHHKRRQVDQLIALLDGREPNRSFQWYVGAITREGKSLAVIVERGPKAGLQASWVYKAAMTPAGFVRGPGPPPPPGPQVSSASPRPNVFRACSDDEEESSGYHIIMLTQKDALGWVEASNGPASG